MLLIFLPVSFVAGTFDVCVDTIAIGLVVHPTAIVDVTISMEELSVATRLVVLPVTFISC